MRFFCTAGRGTEIFAHKEISDEIDNNPDSVSHSEGRVYFHSNLTHIDQILRLKTVERAFALVLHKDSTEYKDLDRAALLQYIRTNILSKDAWEDGELTEIIHYLKTHLNKKLQGGVTHVDEEGPPAKKFKPNVGDGKISFRVSCKSSGICGRKVSSQLLAKQIGIKLSQLMKWKVNFKDPDIEICIQLSDSHVTVGIPLTRIPLSKRQYVKFHGLRGPVTWILTSLLNIQNQSTVLDPMCGKATILLETAKNLENVFCIGCDENIDQLKIAAENSRFANVENKLQLFQGDCRALPLRNESVDCIVCDTPFGKKFSIQESLTVFHTSFLQEMYRVLKRNGRMVLLVSEEMHHIFQKSFTNTGTNIEVFTTKQQGEINRVKQRVLSDSHEQNDQSQASLQVESIHSDSADCLSKAGNNFKCNQVNDKMDESHSDEYIDKQLPFTANRSCEMGKTSEQNENEIMNLLSVFNQFIYVSDHYIKLGETNSYIAVLEKK
ncbi:THUMP domain-containing protein 2-like [Crassostrea angulata]|uniref:THUMP domain-containing protein 2-like n=1 Tax=Magallana angulata TaxID=2784310 RepID=UPI0022B1C000|nr:THUMP domain-containing protein 2-like [Crassostrea angulata]